MGMYPEHLREVINEDAQEFNFYDKSLENMRAKDFEKPECYTPNDDPYPLCKGANTPQGLAENDCYTCCLYEEYKGDDPDER